MKYLKNVVSLKLDVTVCIGCGRCLDVCPHAVFDMAAGKSVIVARDACMECGACARNCPVEALEVQSGVGCATGLLNVALGREGACCGEKQACCCSGTKPEAKESSQCGCGESGGCK